MSSDTRPDGESSTRVDAEDRPTPQLIVLLDRSRPFAGASRHLLANVERVTIGRTTTRTARRTIEAGRRTLVLGLPDERASADHAYLDRESGGWRFVDRRSTNGSWVNRQRASDVILRDGDVLEVGRTLVRFRAARLTPANAPGDLTTDDLEGLPACAATLLPGLGRDMDRLARVAASDVPVLLLGETGTGKEVVARGIHAESRRRGPFIPVNCGALPAGLVEAMLFGHVRGAFSGATHSAPGFVRAAEGGTLFLDEVADLPASSQAVLLRVLQEREVVAIGATSATRVDVRIVAATHRPLEPLLEAEAFRQDLYARLSAFTCVLPPLRLRVDDLGVLLAALRSRLAAVQAGGLSMSTESAYWLLQHDWPRNVRELEQRLRVGSLLAEKGHLALTRAASEPSEEGTATAQKRTDAEHLGPEDRAIHAQLVAKLREHRGNVTRVGLEMGKARTQVQRWMRRLRIDAKQFR